MTRDDFDLLIAAMRANGVTRLEWGKLRKGRQLCLTLSGETDPAPPPKPLSEDWHVARSPGIGRFVPRGGGDGLPPLQPGVRVGAGETLGYVAQGVVLQVIAAPVAGWLSGALPEVGQIFGYGDPVLDLIGAQE